jgi:hypothetical protein
MKCDMHRAGSLGVLGMATNYVYGDVIPGLPVRDQAQGYKELGHGTPNPLVIARVQALNPNPFFQGSHKGNAVRDPNSKEIGIS